MDSIAEDRLIVALDLTLMHTPELAGEAKRIRERVNHEIMEIFYARNIAR